MSKRDYDSSLFISLASEEDKSVIRRGYNAFLSLCLIYTYNQEDETMATGTGSKRNDGMKVSFSTNCA